MKYLITLLFCLGVASSHAAQANQVYCFTQLWGGELVFTTTTPDLKTSADQVVNQCKHSIGAADADLCISNLSCDVVDEQGKFVSVIDVSKLFAK